MINLLVNGSFEDPVIVPGSYSPRTSILGWTAIPGGYIEVFRSAFGVNASDGNNFLELDNIGDRDGFSQSVTTIAGQSYNLSFDARLRIDNGAPANSQTIEILWNGALAGTFNPATASWTTFNLTVTGTGGADVLTVREAAAQSSDGFGAWLDNFVLAAPEPAGPVAPVAVDDAFTGLRGFPMVLNLTANDTDANGDALQITQINGSIITSVPLNSTFEIGGVSGQFWRNPDGTLLFLPTAPGSYSFNYVVSDGTLTDTGAVSISVNALAPRPPGTNVIANGSFEFPIGGSNPGAFFPNLPGWGTFNNNSAPTIYYMPVFTNLNGVTAADGSNFSRVYSSSGVSLYQFIDGVGGQTLRLTFSTRADPQGGADQTFGITFDGVTLGSVTPGQTWQTHSVYITPASSGGLLGFSGGFYNNSAFIDGVSLIVVGANEVNGAPVATPDSVTVPYGEDAEMFPLRNDTDPNGNLLRITHINGAPLVQAFGYELANLNENVAIYHDRGQLYLNFQRYEAGTYNFTYTVTDGLASTTTSASFTIAAPPPDAVGNSSSTATPLAMGTIALSAIDYIRDADWYAVQLTAGQLYTMRLGGVGANGISDTIIELYNSNGVIVSSNDDGDPIGDSLLVYTPTQSGTYYVVATPYYRETGDYSLLVRATTLIQGSFPNNTNLVGTSGADEIMGSSGDDILTGNAGDDILFGGSGNDQLYPGPGNDIIVATPAGQIGYVPDSQDLLVLSDSRTPAVLTAIQIDLEAGLVAQDGYGGSDILAGLQQVWVLSPFQDSISGSNRNDAIYSFGGGGDILLGRGGFDRFFISRAPSLIDGGTNLPTDGYNITPTIAGDRLSFVSSDYLSIDANGDGQLDIVPITRGVHVDLTLGRIVDDGFGGSGQVLNIESLGGTRLADRLIGDDQLNVLAGGQGDDTLIGMGGNDILIGDAGADTIVGGEGDDQIDGGAGADWMTGGHGRDIFGIVLNSASSDHMNGDVIFGFEMGDRLQISVPTGTLRFIGTSAFSNVAGQIRYGFQSGSMVVEVDYDGNGSADHSMKLSGLSSGALVAPATGSSVLSLSYVRSVILPTRAEGDSKSPNPISELPGIDADLIDGNDLIWYASDASRGSSPFDDFFFWAAEDENGLPIIRDTPNDTIVSTPFVFDPDGEAVWIDGTAWIF